MTLAEQRVLITSHKTNVKIVQQELKLRALCYFCDAGIYWSHSDSHWFCADEECGRPIPLVKKEATNSQFWLGMKGDVSQWAAYWLAVPEKDVRVERI